GPRTCGAWSDHGASKRSHATSSAPPHPRPAQTCPARHQSRGTRPTAHLLGNCPGRSATAGGAAKEEHMSSRQRLGLILAAGAVVSALVAVGGFPAAASAHGIVGKTNLPVPQEVFIAASSGVLIISFLALAVLWQRPLLETDKWRPLPPLIGRVLTSVPAQ